MGDGFEVRHDALNRLARDLQQVTAVTGQAMDALASRDGAATLGTSDLDGAASHFKDAWKYGLKKLKENLEGTTSDIRTTAKQYQDAEDQISAALDRYRLPA